ncbi:MAG: Phosphoglycolate phosphatase [Desulfovibrio sp.]
MKPTLSGFIFDLDGTLIDSLEDLADSVNTALAERSLPTHPVEPYKYFVGDGMNNLVLRACPKGCPTDTVNSVFARVKEEYGKNWAKKTRLYDGIRPMLERLAAQGVPTAVLTNKPHEFTREVVDHFLPGVSFIVAQGNRGDGKAKPDPTLALEIAARMGLAPGAVGFVGDSRTDMDTACNAGMVAVGVLWGFRPEKELLDHGATVILGHPDELFEKVTITA